MQTDATTSRILNSAAKTRGHIQFVPLPGSSSSLGVSAIERELHEGGAALRLGRFTDRSGIDVAELNALDHKKLLFKSKVVGRAQAEIWVEAGGKFFIKDTKSSSGTFLNDIRLSPVNTESTTFEVKDGDVLQLGMDYQGGKEDIYRAVKMRIVIGRKVDT
ncbi:hypothetical protein D9613_012337 [Agrocybe pediades]|uniref:FHA domain-containing protein n=1 Tax=Agrocybe pediades TaxID=84607 RepID=A0A8H4VHQ6_9AGAR|nr:hypothetical protein D9613_012337 [Agrocybe pediades]